MSGSSRPEELFAAAVAMTPDERTAYLRERCAGDLDALLEVESLLRYHDGAGSVLESPLGGPSGSGSIVDLAPRLPERIGSYAIKGVLGTGGMGVVYRAEQERPRRSVALKVMRPGLVSAGVLRRFEHEAQTLALLRHPGIAQVYEAGMADTGAGPQPFFAMELVNGPPLDVYAERAGLRTRARLELLARVCDAVQHAHQRGVIHRDLKPGNILVGEDGQPKVLDFGVARVTDVQATTLHTGLGQLVGTLAYMSPEQVDGDPGALDTRSDVYALGVVLYQLLTKRLPHDVSRATVPAAIRAIKEEEPARLSSVDRALRGDIETIVAKATEKDRQRRYQSASELAEDIRRYLRDEPVVARPASRVYQLRKFAKRNKVLVGGVVAVFAALLLGVIGTGIGLARSLAAEKRTADALLDVKKAEHSAREEARRARAQAVKAQAASAFMQRVLSSTDPEQARGREITAREMLAGASMLARTELAGQPDVAAGAHLTIGNIYKSLALFEPADAELALAVEEATRAGADGTVVLGQALGAQAERLLADGHPDRALERIDAGLAAIGVNEGVGADEPARLELLNVRAQVLEDLQRGDEAEGIYRDIVERAARTRGPDDRATLSYQNNLAIWLGDHGDYEKSEQLHRSVLDARRRTLGGDHPDTATSMRNVGSVLRRRGRYAEAEPYYRGALAVREKVYGAEDPQVADDLNGLATLMRQLGQPDEAEKLYRRSLAIYQSRMRRDYPRIPAVMQNLASLRQAQGDLNEAASLFDEALRLRQAAGGDNPQTAMILANIAGLREGLGDLPAAESAARRSLELRRQMLGERHETVGATLAVVARIVSAQKRYDEADSLFTEALDIQRGVHGARHPAIASTLRMQGESLLVRGDVAVAEPVLREALAMYTELVPTDKLEPAKIKRLLGETVLAQGRAAEAEQLFLEAYGVLSQAGPGAAKSSAQTRDGLARVYAALGRPDEAARWSAAEGE